MFVSDPIGDMIVRIRNAGMRHKPFTDVPVSRVKEGILQALQREGYIKGFDVMGQKVSDRVFRVHLKYHYGKPVISSMKRISKPSVEFYSSVKNLTPVANGLGNMILSTSLGILSDTEAKSKGVGGKILMHIN